MTALRTALDAASPKHVADTEAMRAVLAGVEAEHAVVDSLLGSLVRLGEAGVGDVGAVLAVIEEVGAA